MRFISRYGEAFGTNKIINFQMKSIFAAIFATSASAWLLQSDGLQDNTQAFWLSANLDEKRNEYVITSMMARRRNKPMEWNAVSMELCWAFA